MGYVTPELIDRLPGYLSLSAGLTFAGAPNGLAAISRVPDAGLAEHGHAATLIKLSVQALGLVSSSWGDGVLYIAFPLRALETKLGVQALVAFWDPAGFVVNGSIENFVRRRPIEIKHGHIVMLTVMGYIAPETIGQRPGYLSPAAGLKCVDDPNGLSATWLTRGAARGTSGARRARRPRRHVRGAGRVIAIALPRPVRRRPLRREVGPEGRASGGRRGVAGSAEGGQGRPGRRRQLRCGRPGPSRACAGELRGGL
eukprot:6636977-Heterocapsa_arctica.AAC.1